MLAHQKPSKLALEVALLEACRRALPLSEDPQFLPDVRLPYIKSPRAIRTAVLRFVREQSDTPMTEQHETLMALRFVCEALADADPTQKAQLLEDEFLAVARQKMTERGIPYADAQ